MDYLKQLETWDVIIQNKIAEQDQWKLAAHGITAHLDGERVQSSGSKQKMAEAIDRYVDLEREIAEHIDRLIDKKCEVISLLDKLAYVNKTYYDVLHKMYIGKVIMQNNGIMVTERMDFTDIADLYGKSYSWVTTIHGRALQSFQKILDAFLLEFVPNCD